jgi:hypothetical protein
MDVPLTFTDRLTQPVEVGLSACPEGGALSMPDSVLTKVVQSNTFNMTESHMFEFEEVPVQICSTLRRELPVKGLL